MKVKLEQRDIAIAKSVSAFVHSQFPGRKVLSIEYNSEGVPDEGFSLTVTLFPVFRQHHPHTHTQLSLKIWIGAGEYIDYDGRQYSLDLLSNGTYAVYLPQPVPETT